MPSVLVYQLKTADNKVDSEWINNIDTSVLHMDFKCVQYSPPLVPTTANTSSDPMQRNTLTVFSTLRPSARALTPSWHSTQNSSSPSRPKSR